MSIEHNPDSLHPSLTKIIATVGPASSDDQSISRMIEAGVSVFRLNFSHGSLETHKKLLRTIRHTAEMLQRPVAVMGDLPGPKIRLGEVAGGSRDIETGSTVSFHRTGAEVEENQSAIRLYSTYNGLIDGAQPGQRLLINDGAVRLLIVQKTDEELICTVSHGGLISTGKGINLPDTMLTAQVLTDRDRSIAAWAVAHDVDFLAQSFVASANDVVQLQEALKQIQQAHNKVDQRMPIIAKIERPAAVDCIESIVEAADGIMVARGDLGVEMDLACVPVVQKKLLATAQAHGKPCIVATQMFESMIHAPSPTRAEVSDVAGAIFDATDAVMLSGETAVGKYPVLVVEMMRRVALRTEQYIASLPAAESPPKKLVESGYQTAALAHGVWTVARDFQARFIIIWSQQGGGARYLSQNNFNIPIIAASNDERALRQMQMLRGVLPIWMSLPDTQSQFAQMIDVTIQESGLGKQGDRCILVAGEPFARQGETNSLTMYRIGDTSHWKKGS